MMMSQESYIAAFIALVGSMDIVWPIPPDIPPDPLQQAGEELPLVTGEMRRQQAAREESLLYSTTTQAHAALVETQSGGEQRLTVYAPSCEGLQPCRILTQTPS